MASLSNVVPGHILDIFMAMNTKPEKCIHVCYPDHADGCNFAWIASFEIFKLAFWKLPSDKACNV